MLVRFLIIIVMVCSTQLFSAAAAAGAGTVEKTHVIHAAEILPDLVWKNPKLKAQFEDSFKKLSGPAKRLVNGDSLGEMSERNRVMLIMAALDQDSRTQELVKALAKRSKIKQDDLGAMCVSFFYVNEAPEGEDTVAFLKRYKIFIENLSAYSLIAILKILGGSEVGSSVEIDTALFDAHTPEAEAQALTCVEEIFTCFTPMMRTIAHKRADTKTTAAEKLKVAVQHYYHQRLLSISLQNVMKDEVLAEEMGILALVKK